jgi:serine/threonine protein kinase
MIDRFEIVQPIASHGIADTYLASDAKHGKVKLHLVRLSELNDESRQQCIAHVRTVSKLRHKHLAAIWEVVESDEYVGLVTRFVDGIPLSKLVAHRTIVEPKQAALLTGKLALAVNQFHAAELTHGTLSTGSIVIDEAKEPILSDYGLARLTLLQSKSGSDALVNDFSAPEVDSTLGTQADARSDVYSLGCIGTLMMTGLIPTSGADLFNSSAPPGMGEDLYRLYQETFSKCLSHDPETRFASANGLAKAMEQLNRKTPHIHLASRGAKQASKSGDDQLSDQFQQFDVQTIESNHVVHLHDESVSTTDSIARTKDELRSLIGEESPEKMILNFASVRHCSSEAISMLIQLKTELMPYGTTLYLCGMRDSIREVFRVLNLDGKVFQIRDTVQVALHSTT